MSEDLFYFEKLKVWQSARVLARQVYNLCLSFPNTERYGLADQLKRAAVSVPSNIAESSGRSGDKDRLRFLNFAYGSLMEIRCQLILAQDLGFISAEQVDALSSNIIEISRMLGTMRKKLSANDD